MFFFADPVQVLKAVNIYCGDHYGSMLWDLYGSMLWSVLQMLEYLYQASMEMPKKYACLLRDMSTGCRFCVNQDQANVKFLSSTTGGNLYRLGQETGPNVWEASPTMVRMALEQIQHANPALK